MTEIDKLEPITHDDAQKLYELMGRLSVTPNVHNILRNALLEQTDNTGHWNQLKQGYRLFLQASNSSLETR